MTYEVYYYIFLGSAILSAIMFVVSVILFFALKIPTVIGDLTGANARKAIENIRSQNESSGNKTYQSSTVNRERGKLTDKISPSGRLIKDPSHSIHGAMATAKIGTQKLTPEDLGGGETMVLTAELTGAGETTLLSEQASTAPETSVLAQPNAMAAFTVEYEIMLIHTNEVIV